MYTGSWRKWGGLLSEHYYYTWLQLGLGSLGTTRELAIQAGWPYIHGPYKWDALYKEFKFKWFKSIHSQIRSCICFRDSEIAGLVLMNNSPRAKSRQLNLRHTWDLWELRFCLRMYKISLSPYNHLRNYCNLASLVKKSPTSIH